MNKIIVRLIIFFSILSLPVLGWAGQVQLYAAGSLKVVLSEIAQAFEQVSGASVKLEFGPSGILRQRIDKEGQAHIFASANMEHPQSLASAGKGGPVAQFTRNNLCAIAQPSLDVSSTQLLDVMLDPKVRVGISTPKADPAGDYAWELFVKAGKLKPGSYELLSGKALQLTGGPDSEKAPEGRNQYGWVMAEKKADIFLTYCTNAVLAQHEVPTLQIVPIVQELAVGADYGLIVLNEAPEEASRLAAFILSVEGQKIFKKHGFVTAGISVQ